MGDNLREALNHLSNSRSIADMAFKDISSPRKLFISWTDMLESRALSAASSPLVPGREPVSVSGAPSGDSFVMLNEVASVVAARSVVRRRTKTRDCNVGSTCSWR
jgi:hypothetical protein